MEYSVQESQEILHQLGVPRIQNETLQSQKKTWNRENLNENNDWIIQKKKLKEYESSSEVAKDFLNRVYNDENYIRWSLEQSNGTKRKIARGANAKNWKNNGEWFCDSLHFSENIYSNLGKQKWTKSGNHGKQDTPCIEDQCTIITKQGRRCNRSKMDNYHICTQHFNMLN